MMADGRLALGPQVGAQLGHVPFLLAQEHQDLQPCRVEDLLEQIRRTRRISAEGQFGVTFGALGRDASDLGEVAAM